MGNLVLKVLLPNQNSLPFQFLCKPFGVVSMSTSKTLIKGQNWSCPWHSLLSGQDTSSTIANPVSEMSLPISASGSRHSLPGWWNK